MHRVTTNNLFDIEAFSFKGETNHVSWHSAFYQQIVAKLIKAVYDREALTKIGDRLIALADHAVDLKQFETVEQVSRLLTFAALPQVYHRIADYYRASCLKGRGEPLRARAEFQRLAVSTSLPRKFRARAIQSLGVSYFEKGQFDEALRYYAEAAQAAAPEQGSKLLLTVNAQLAAAIYRSVAGDHDASLRHLESLRPLVRLLAPQQLLPRYIYANSLAVELGEAGRLEEARHLSEAVVRSPYAGAYPEWQETRAEVLAKMRRPSPSVVGGVHWPQQDVQETSPVRIPPHAAHNVIALPLAPRPAVSPAATGTANPPLARIIAYHGWRQAIPKPSDTLPEIFTPGDLEQMSIADKQTALLTVIYGDDVTHDTLDQLLAAASKVTTDKPTH